MGKLSLLLQETTFTLSDFLVKVKAAAGGDVLITFQNFLAAVNANLASVQDTWHGAAYSNSWVDFDTGSPATSTWGGVQYYKDSVGVVHMRGMAKSGTLTGGTVMLTLPAGYRPGITHMFELNSADARSSVDIKSDGTVLTRSGMSASWVSFAGITFRAEN